MDSIDENEIEQIVDTMKKKYKEQGIDIEDENEELGELRNIISKKDYYSVDIQTEEDIENFDNDFAKTFGKIYLKLSKILEPIKNNLENFPLSKELGYYLYSANMKYSPNQYLAIASSLGFVIALLTLVITIIIGIFTENLIFKLIIPIIGTIMAWLLTTIIILIIPQQKAISRGNACSVELPFALRHISTELKAGMGLYKTIKTIATNNYGVLSEEFAKTIVEIEDGTETKTALKHTALRTQSRPLKKTITNILRALRVGGNLSTTLEDIAEEVSDDLHNRISIFSQRMNFFSVVYIFLGIVLPVSVMILGTIRNSDITGGDQNLFKNLPLTPEVMVLIYLVLMPILFGVIIFVIYNSQPKVG